MEMGFSIFLINTSIKASSSMVRRMDLELLSSSMVIYMMDNGLKVLKMAEECTLMLQPR